MSAPRSLASALGHKSLGVAFLALVLFFVWGTYAIFTKKFVDYVPVTLETSKIGLQLPALADVKIRGVIVGDVRGISSTGDGATLDLAIDPDKASIIPANATAMILPKTLFGEKYVSLQVPEQPSSDSIAAGDTITQAEVALEVEKVLTDVYPLLRTVQPAEISYTLNALATALEGRGDKIGRNLVILDDYLKRTNPQIPLLIDDLRKLGEVSEVYRSVVPELANLLRNSVTTGRTFVEKEQKIEALFADVASFSSTSKDFLEQNGDNIIRLSEQGQQQLPMYARYSSEYPCLLNGIVDQLPMQEQSFRGYTLHINLEVLPRQPRGYDRRDDPAYADRRGPIDQQLCRTVMGNSRWGQNNLPPDYAVAPKLQTGVDYPVGKRVAPGPAVDMTSGYAGTASERSVVNSIAAPAMGVSADEVPDVATLLFGPLARGTEVSVR